MNTVRRWTIIDLTPNNSTNFDDVYITKPTEQFISTNGINPKFDFPTEK